MASKRNPDDSHQSRITERENSTMEDDCTQKARASIKSGHDGYLPVVQLPVSGWSVKATGSVCFDNELDAAKAIQMFL